MSDTLSVTPKCRPILFSAPMVRAILSGRKTQTRRAVSRDIAEALEFVGGRSDGEPTTAADISLEWMASESDAGKMVKTQWCLSSAEYPEEGCIPIGDGYGAVGDLLWVRETWGVYHDCYLKEAHEPTFYRADEDCEELIRWRPSIHMPRWRSRLTLRITDVRVQRLQEISEFDCEQEGVGHAMTKTAKERYAELWDAINGAGAWASNPWVWAISFERI